MRVCVCLSVCAGYAFCVLKRRRGATAICPDEYARRAARQVAAVTSVVNNGYGDMEVAEITVAIGDCMGCAAGLQAVAAVSACGATVVTIDVTARSSEIL